MDREKCPLCGSIANYQNECNGYYYECPCCGNFKIKNTGMKDQASREKFYDKLAPYLYYHWNAEKEKNGEEFYYFVGSKVAFEQEYEEFPWCGHVTAEIVNNWYPKTFNEKINIFLLGLADRTNFLGEPVDVSPEQFASACFVLRNPGGQYANNPNSIREQCDVFEHYLEDNGYIETGDWKCVLLPKGLERVDELQKNQSQTTKNVFVAMSFAPEMNEVREAIKAAITECGFMPRIMDEIEHNHQIVPEMLYEIRQARFVIAELTGHNNGAYYEAGYALGNGKEVIHLCNADKFSEDGHFDVKQVNTVLWKTTEELTTKLVARIKATIS